MGSCLSKKSLPCNNNSKDKQKPVSKDPAVESTTNEAAPPPLPPPHLDDEAVVKEVLTETPVPSRTAEDVEGAPEKGGSVPAAADDVCSCSVSETFSASTTMAAEGPEDGEAEVAGSGPVAAKWRPRELPPVGNGHHRRRRSASGEFPSWMEARGGAGWASSRIEPTRASLQHLGNHGNGAARVVRGDPGERSGRRSASPAARREASLRAAGGRGGGGGASRCSSTRWASPRRRSPPPGAAAEGASRKRGTGVSEEEEGGQLGAAPPEETLESPLVSLECFIFL